MNEWIKVSDRLPSVDDGQALQVIANSHRPESNDLINVVVCAVFSGGKFYNCEYWGNGDPDDNEEIRLKWVSHWMYLPPHP
jgi:hypothetical protein